MERASRDGGGPGKAGKVLKTRQTSWCRTDTGRQVLGRCYLTEVAGLSVQILISGDPTGRGAHMSAARTPCCFITRGIDMDAGSNAARVPRTSPGLPGQKSIGGDQAIGRRLLGVLSHAAAARARAATIYI